MTRVKRSVPSRKKTKKLLKAVKGYRGKNSKIVKLARQAWMKAGQHAYRNRKENKSGRNGFHKKLAPVL
mgnify:CR=1 FL=1